jgi:hypothetical protein
MDLNAYDGETEGVVYAYSSLASFGYKYDGKRFINEKNDILSDFEVDL